ncbi:MAG: hypothetical protein ABI318_03695 [Chthoniobacteraceae bacterium]
MRLSLLLWLATAASLEAQPFHWPWSSGSTTEKKEARHFRLPWNSRATEQRRLNAAVEPKPTSREEQILRPDTTKAFNLGSAKFGSGQSVTGKKAATSEFYFQNKTRTKAFATSAVAAKPAWGTDSKFATRSAETKESWFARLTAHTKSYETRESRDANKGLQGRVLPGSDKSFVARGRRQAELDKNGAAGITMGGDREGGQSWGGDVKPLTIQDVRTLLNKN